MKSKRIPNSVVWILLVILAVLLVYLIVVITDKPGKYDEFAKCLDKEGATFYGAFWCPHCQEQKAEFGKSSKYLPYVECSTPDMQGQTAVCQEKKIPGYPTWEFADGIRETRTFSLEELSQKTGCPLPQ